MNNIESMDGAYKEIVRSYKEYFAMQQDGLSIKVESDSVINFFGGIPKSLAIEEFRGLLFAEFQIQSTIETLDKDHFRLKITLH